MITVTVDKNFKPVVCGTIEEVRDAHGNAKFLADRTVRGDKFEFWTKGGADLWLRLGGLLDS